MRRRSPEQRAARNASILFGVLFLLSAIVSVLLMTGIL